MKDGCVSGTPTYWVKFGIAYCLYFYLVSGLGMVQANSFLQFAQKRVDSVLPETGFRLHIETGTDILSTPAPSYI
jgi:hypothetical protein